MNDNKSCFLKNIFIAIIYTNYGERQNNLKLNVKQIFSY